MGESQSNVRALRRMVQFLWEPSDPEDDARGRSGSRKGALDDGATVDRSRKYTGVKMQTLREVKYRGYLLREWRHEVDESNAIVPITRWHVIESNNIIRMHKSEADARRFVDDRLQDKP
jgi:hypothetical protein